MYLILPGMSTTKLKVLVLSHVYTAAGPQFWQLSEVPETRCLTTCEIVYR